MASKEDIKLEQEYQAALKISQSAVASMQADIEATLKSKKALSKEAKALLNDLKSQASQLSDSESIYKEIMKNEEQIGKIQKSNNGLSAKAKKIVIDELKQRNNVLNAEYKIQSAIERVNEKANQLNDTMGRGVDKAVSFGQNIPIIGQAFGGTFTRMGDAVKGKLTTATKKFTTTYAKGMQSGIGNTRALGMAAGAAGKSMLAAFAGPQAIILLIVAALGAGFMAMMKFEKAARSFRDTTGTIRGQFDGIDQRATAAAASTMSMTGSMEDGAKMAGEFFNVFGGVEDVSQAVMENVIALEAGLGVSAKSAGETNKMFQNMFGASQEVAQQMVSTVSNAARLADVSPDKVVTDMAESSEEMLKYFRGSPQQLQKMAIQAAKLGTSLKQSAEVSASLLDFESSINNELEASALLGTNINFNQARYLAANGDTLGAQQAVLKQVSKLGDLTKLNVYEQEALAKAAGMPIKDLINQQRIQKMLGTRDKEKLAAAQKLIAAGKDVSKMSKKELEAELKKQKAQDYRNGQIEKMQNTFKQLGFQIMQAFMPLAQALTSFVKDNMPAIKSFFGGLQTFLGGIVSGFMNGLGMIRQALQPVFDIFSELFGGGDAEGFGKTLAKIGEIIGTVLTYGLNVTARIFAGIAQQAAGLFKIVKGIFTLDFSLIGKGISQMFKGFIDKITAIPETILTMLASIFPNVTLFEDLKNGFLGFMDYIKALPEKIVGFFMSIPGRLKNLFANILPGWAKKLLGISDASETQATLSDGGSIDDGIVQNGKVISTNPADTIMATKEPDSLFGKISAMNPFAGAMDTVKGALGGVMNNLTGTNDEMMIAKLDELITVTKESRDVYLGKEKVTDVITDTQERTGRENRFGIAGA